jgi:hypothetical protein
VLAAARDDEWFRLMRGREMKIGFTGTREGLTAAQRDKLVMLVVAPEEFHHGCCVGADEQAAHIAFSADCPRIVGHPPTATAMLSEFSLGFNTENHDPLPYLERNRRIVDACETLIACPKGPEEQRSGTWATVRYARKQKKQILIIWPNGTVSEERP